MPKRKHDYLSREPLHIASVAALLMFMLSIIPKMSRLNDAFMKRMMAGSDADNDDEDGEIAAASAALDNDEDDEIDEAFVMQLVQHDMALAWGFLALLLRRETQALAVSPFIKKDPTDFFAWQNSLFDSFFCFKKGDIVRLRRALEIPDTVIVKTKRKGRTREELYNGDWAFCVFLVRFRSTDTLIRNGIICGLDWREVSRLHNQIQLHIYNYKVSTTYPQQQPLPPGGRHLLDNLEMWAPLVPELLDLGEANGIPRKVSPLSFIVSHFPLSPLWCSPLWCWPFSCWPS
jgi:hypothetical protein